MSDRADHRGGTDGADGSTAAADAAGPIAIRPMRRGDLRAVMAIDRHGMHRAWSLPLYLAELRAPEGRLYAVALEGRRVVGFAGMLTVLDEAHVTNIGTRPSHRRRGIAARLLLVLAHEARRVGVRGITLEVAAGNDAAVGLYERFGFTVAGVRKDYYSDVGQDALVMWLHDIDQIAAGRALAAIQAETGPTRIEGWGYDGRSAFDDWVPDAPPGVPSADPAADRACSPHCSEPTPVASVHEEFRA